VETAVKVQDSVALPEPVTLVGATEQDVLLVVRPTTPAKPLTAVTVIVEVPAAFTLTLTLDGLAAIVKSWTVKVTGPPVWDSSPLEPVTETGKVPVVVNVQDRVLVPEPGTVGGLSVHAVLLADRLTVPEKPLRPVTVTVEVPGEFTFKVTDVGLALIVKSWTM